jgi:sugar O-acyltransferase (sialic acid O-acetyltransferase NeuD family)
MNKILVIGAKGLAKEILFSFPNIEGKLIFFDDVNDDNNYLFNKFRIVKNRKELLKLTRKKEFSFIVGVGGADNRAKITKTFIEMAGKPLTLISQKSKIGKYETIIQVGSIIMDDVLITNSVAIGKGGLINKSVIISHDVTIGDFCDISPDVKIMGHSKIGKKVEIGTGAIIIPKINIGDNVTIGAGSVVINDIPSNVVIAGNPARVIKWN